MCSTAQHSAVVTRQEYFSTSEIFPAIICEVEANGRREEPLFLFSFFCHGCLFTSVRMERNLKSTKEHTCLLPACADKVLRRNLENCVLVFFSRWGVLQFVRNVFHWEGSGDELAWYADLLFKCSAEPYLVFNLLDY